MHIKTRVLPDLLPNLPGISPIMQRIYASRGITDVAQLQTTLTALVSFEKLTDIEKACLRLEKALRDQQRILIVGDFDADGATSSALVVSALRAMGALHVEFLVPNRFEFGYGLTTGIIEVAKQWRPNLIITVDNGIASFEGVAAANQAGIDVLVTDHHLPGDSLPNACAIVNPNRHHDEFPSKSIAGVGVIFYVMLALRRHLINAKWFEEIKLTPPNMSQFLDLVALGTVADVVPLDQNNRILVQQGITRIRQGLARPGIIALLKIAGKNPATIREIDLGFAIAPRLNAAGRLDDMALGIECLLSDKLDKATMLATQLDELNLERRKIEAEMSEKAGILVHKIINDVTTNALPVAFCLVDKSWHQGVIGILAGRLKERHHRPVIIFAMVSDTELKGSARSISGLNIRDVLASIDINNPGLINKFGGHAMAAGLSLHPDSFKVFHAEFLKEVSNQLDLSIDPATIYSDGALEQNLLTLDFATQIQNSGPWGQQFPEPLFDNVFELVAQRIVGQNHLKLTVALPNTNEPIDAIAFNVDLKEWPNHRARYVHAAYKLDLNIYQGRTKLQLIISALKPVER
jgi:single-stranded-DNA-specific exonuclease